MGGSATSDWIFFLPCMVVGFFGGRAVGVGGEGSRLLLFSPLAWLSLARKDSRRREVPALAGARDASRRAGLFRGGSSSLKLVCTWWPQSVPLLAHCAGVFPFFLSFFLSSGSLCF